MSKKFKKIIAMTLIAGSFSVVAYAQNHISSNVWKDSQGGNYRASGWVCMLDNSGNGVYHYSTAQLKSFFGTVYESSGRQWGTGKVSATTPWNPNNGSAKIYYGQ